MAKLIASTVTNPYRNFNLSYTTIDNKYITQKVEKVMASIKTTEKKKSSSKVLSEERKAELEEQILDNFILLTEVQFDKNNDYKPLYYEDFIEPHLVEFFEVLNEHGYTLTKLHFPIGSQKCNAFIKETPWEIDYLKTRFFEKRKRHGSK